MPRRQRSLQRVQSSSRALCCCPVFYIYWYWLVCSFFLICTWSKPGKSRLTQTQVSLLVPNKLILHLPEKPGTSGGGGGGGRRESTPASLGRLPRAADRQLTPPVPKVVNLNPVLPVEPTVIAPQLSQLPAVNLPYYGDPFGVPGPPSSGPGTGGGNWQRYWRWCGTG